MADRDEAQVRRWAGIKERVGDGLRELRLGKRSQLGLAADLEELGYHVTQSMVSRYEQGLPDVPLSLERLVGWALCCEALTSSTFKELLTLAGYYLPWDDRDLREFNQLLRHYRTLPLHDQGVLRRSLLWHILGIEERERE
jgi:hypothetical protein